MDTTIPTIYDHRVLSSFYDEFGFKLEDQLLMSCYVGSQSHGTTIGPLDDIDIFAVIIPPANKILGLEEWDNWVFQKDELDVTVFSLQKWFGLLIKNNPNMLGTLWLKPELYTYVSEDARTILERREIFSSILAYYSFSGYAQAQLAKLQIGAYKGYMGKERKKLVDELGYDPKNAAHLIRLYRMGVEFCNTGILQVYRPDREELISIKRGEWSLEKVKLEGQRLSEEMEKAKLTSKLHLRPEIETISELCVNIHKRYLLGG